MRENGAAFVLGERADRHLCCRAVDLDKPWPARLPLLPYGSPAKEYPRCVVGLSLAASSDFQYCWFF